MVERGKTIKCHWEGCSEELFDRLALESHSIQHSSQVDNTCGWNNCTKMFQNHKHFVEHVNKHFGFRPFACREDGCGIRCFTMEERAAHENSHDVLDPDAGGSREGSAPLTAEKRSPSEEPALPEANEAPSSSIKHRCDADVPESADVSFMTAVTTELLMTPSSTIVSPKSSARVSSGRLENTIQRLFNMASSATFLSTASGPESVEETSPPLTIQQIVDEAPEAFPAINTDVLSRPAIPVNPCPQSSPQIPQNDPPRCSGGTGILAKLLASPTPIRNSMSSSSPGIISNAVTPATSSAKSSSPLPQHQAGALATAHTPVANHAIDDLSGSVAASHVIDRNIATEPYPAGPATIVNNQMQTGDQTFRNRSGGDQKRRYQTQSEHTVHHFPLARFSSTESHPYLHCVPATARDCSSEPTSLPFNIVPISDVADISPIPGPPAKSMKTVENPGIDTLKPPHNASKTVHNVRETDKAQVPISQEGRGNVGAKTIFKVPKPPKASSSSGKPRMKPQEFRINLADKIEAQKLTDNKQLRELYKIAMPITATTFCLKSLGPGQHMAQTLADIVVSHDLTYEISEIERNTFPLCVLHTILHNQGPCQALNVIKAWEKHELLRMLPYPAVENFFKREATVKYSGTYGLFNKPLQTAQRNAAFLTNFASGKCCCEGNSCFLDFAQNAWSLLTDGQQQQLHDFCRSFDFRNYFAS